VQPELLALIGGVAGEGALGALEPVEAATA
jgi:hypothetical protein